jgi:hypothetical protein
MADQRQMLIALLGDDRLQDKERTAFEDMSSGLQLSPKARLSRAQLDWVERRFRDLELDANVSLNLHSEGRVPEGRIHGVPPVVFPWEREGGLKRPLDPPGRKKKS